MADAMADNSMVMGNEENDQPDKKSGTTDDNTMEGGAPSHKINVGDPKQASENGIWN